MKLLVIGSGGREHALAWKLAQSSRVQQVFVAPGSAAIDQEDKCQSVSISATDLPGLVSFAQQNAIDFALVGPEAPLVIGVVDAFEAAGLKCFGPKKGAAQLEGSKAFTKDFLAKYNIPTADYRVFSQIDPAKDYVRQMGAPIVIKADGLAAGKGVVVAQTQEQAFAAIDDMLSGNKFGEAGSRVVIEEFLRGEEASFIVMVDGEHILPMATSQDHKARDDGDLGPNTGGMGAYSPAPVITPAVFEKTLKQIIEPTVRGMAAEGLPYSGFLYAGLMIDAQGNPKTLEYNCRFGDPETQPIMMRLESDLVDLVEAALAGKLNQVQAHWKAESAVGVVMASRNYPEDPIKGEVISGLELARAKGCKVFHAATLYQDDKWLTHGGRVICVTALGHDLKAAQHLAYAGVSAIHWPAAFFRSDIGFKALKNS